jgi:hypothetical protein
VAGFTATYDFHYDKSTDTEKQSSGDVIQTLEGKLTLKKSGASYLVANSGQRSITVTGEDNQIKVDSVLPEAMLGTWKVDDKSDTSFTFDADGTITQSTKNNKRQTKVTGVEDKGNNIYHYVYGDGTDTSAFVVSGLGGVGVKYTFGIKIDGDKLRLVVWQANKDDDFDYSKPMLGSTLSKK